jgi:hypothetical protein
MTLLADHGPQAGADQVVSWRVQRLVRAGFPLPMASELAGDCRFDLHALLGLVERGCPPSLAARILDPLPDERRPC